MEDPLISVIVPVYNGKECVADCIEALLASQYPKEKFEIIIVNNNSTDNTEEIIKRYLKPASPVKYILELKKGASLARNTGVSIARGKILAFIDSDALANKDWLEVVEETFSNIAIDGVMGITIGINRNLWADFFQNQYDDYFLAARKRDHNRLTKIDTKNFAIKKSVFLKVNGLNPNIGNSEDVEMGLRLYSQGYRSILNEKMIVRHLNPTKLEKDIKTKREQAFFDYKIALLYNEDIDHRCEKCGNYLFGPRYVHFPEFIGYRDKKFLRLRFTFLKYSFPPLIYSLVLLLKLLHAVGCKSGLYKLYLKTVCFAAWHGRVLSMGSEMGFFHVDCSNDSSLFKRTKK